MAGFGNLGGSDSQTKTSVDNTQLGASDQGTAIQLKGRGSKLVGSTVWKIGKGASVTFSSPPVQTASDLAAQAALRQSSSAPNPISFITGLPQATSPDPQLNPKPVFLGAAVFAVLAVGFLLFKR